ncbi:MAG TPA: hypothetical protein VK307_07425 [Thermoleophilaceae bacterium]|nr:hypothetical protein [Thermoleophilaceae bacterium]
MRIAPEANPLPADEQLDPELHDRVLARGSRSTAAAPPRRAVASPGGRPPTPAPTHAGDA